MHRSQFYFHVANNEQAKNEIKSIIPGNSLAVQWLGLCTSTAGGPGSIPSQGTKILQATCDTHHPPKFLIVSTRIKYLGINLTKEIRDIHYITIFH